VEILIYGGGGVGLGTASCLLKAGVKVVILARPETTCLLRKKGLSRAGIFGSTFARAGSFGAVNSLGDVLDARFDYVLVCVKSFDSEQAAQDLYERRHLLKPPGRIVLFQNGWGNAQVFSRLFPEKAVYNARVITGFTRPEKNQVEVTVHADAIHVGSLYSTSTEEIAPLCAAITAGDIPCKAVPDIEKDLWAKMLFNCPLNAVGAVFGVSYGALGEHEQTRHIMEMVVRETFQVMDAAGYSTYWRSPEEYLDEFYRDLIPITGRHYSSTLQDLSAGKRTEIDALNGAIIKLGQAHRISVPANEILYSMIKYLESQSHLSASKEGCSQ
jgi:2-dehydropantoate 2-reductase